MDQLANKSWGTLLRQVFNTSGWQVDILVVLARDLGYIAESSYQGKGKQNPQPNESDSLVRDFFYS